MPISIILLSAPFSLLYSKTFSANQTYWFVGIGKLSSIQSVFIHPVTENIFPITKVLLLERLLLEVQFPSSNANYTLWELPKSVWCHFQFLFSCQDTIHIRILKIEHLANVLHCKLEGHWKKIHTFLVTFGANYLQNIWAVTIVTPLLLCSRSNFWAWQWIPADQDGQREITYAFYMLVTGRTFFRGANINKCATKIFPI